VKKNLMAKKLDSEWHLFNEGILSDLKLYDSGCERIVATSDFIFCNYRINRKA
jgi:hypothetical protein